MLYLDRRRVRTSYYVGTTCRQQTISTRGACARRTVSVASSFLGEREPQYTRPTDRPTDPPTTAAAACIISFIIISVHGNAQTRTVFAAAAATADTM